MLRIKNKSLRCRYITLKHTFVIYNNVIINSSLLLKNTYYIIWTCSH